MANRVFTNDILLGIETIFHAQLQSALNTVGIYRGNLTWLPPNAVSSMVNGIWLRAGNVTFEEIASPKGLLETYKITILYVRTVNVTKNPVENKIDDLNAIIECVYNNYKPAITLNGGQILWWLPRVADYEPAEDDYVNALASDLVAVSLETEMVVRANFR